VAPSSSRFFMVVLTNDVVSFYLSFFCWPAIATGHPKTRFGIRTIRLPNSEADTYVLQVLEIFSVIRRVESDESTTNCNFICFLWKHSFSLI
jgi:hypothetical protein